MVGDDILMSLSHRHVH